ncbi:hypothetical protein V6N12_058001 [Hibiscus sabdariffa]|uniref:Uncharacterized protein n=1 Tax=Hibiscus sabdariffa TaxID=183260 RepID=A0ABR2AY13_9ROSI
MARRRVNFISGLRVSGEERCEDQDEPRNAAIQFYQQLFSSSMTDGYSYSVRGKLLRLDCSAIDPVVCPVLVEEIRKAFFDMSPLKAPACGNSTTHAFFPDGLDWLEVKERWPVLDQDNISDLQQRLADFFSKVARCNNGVAYWLAKFASDTNFDVMFFESPPDGMEFG